MLDLFRGNHMDNVRKQTENSRKRTTKKTKGRDEIHRQHGPTKQPSESRPKL